MSLQVAKDGQRVLEDRCVKGAHELLAAHSDLSEDPLDILLDCFDTGIHARNDLLITRDRLVQVDLELNARHHFRPELSPLRL